MNDAPGAATPLPLWRVERILSDADGVLVVDKPAGIPVHGGDESLSHSLVARLGSYYRERGESDYLAVHQRLDQETSGLMFLVRDETHNQAYAAAMEAREIRRTYVAVVECKRPLKDRGRIEVFLDHKRGISTATDKKGSGRKRAITHFEVKKRAGARALVELSLETGRTHQIRVSMAFLGAPIVGDELYGGASASRLMLHATSLSGGPLPREFHSAPPEVFVDTLHENTTFPEEFLSLLRDAVTLRAPLLARTSALRLVNGEGDGLFGMTADAFGRYVTLNLYDESLEARASDLAQALLSLGYLGVYEKRRVRADLREQAASELAPAEPILGQPAPPSFVVEENGARFQVTLGDGLSPGLFVDMRDNRRRVREWCGGGRMLNLFCYTGSFSVSAALAGAKTTNVDLSQKALSLARQNFRENDLREEEHRFFKEDAMKFLARAVRRQDLYEMIVLDPPSFATVNKGTFSVKSLYGQAVTDCLKVLAPGGKLLCVTNHRKTSLAALEKTVRSAAQAAGRPILRVRALPSGLDCPRGAEGPFPSKSVLLEVD